jgi:hypothetical protein
MPDDVTPESQESNEETPYIDAPEGGDASGEDRIPRITKALGSFVGGLLDRGKAEIESAARTTRLHLEIRQLEHDRETLFGKLGREVCRLVESAEVDHPALVKGAEKVFEIERRLAALRPADKPVEEPVADSPEELPR